MNHTEAIDTLRSMPTLYGTKRQTRWANELRLSALMAHGQLPHSIAVKADAAWWINNKHAVSDLSLLVFLAEIDL